MKGVPMKEGAKEGHPTKMLFYRYWLV